MGAGSDSATKPQQNLSPNLPEFRGQHAHSVRIYACGSRSMGIASLHGSAISIQFKLCAHSVPCYQTGSRYADPDKCLETDCIGAYSSWTLSSSCLLALVHVLKFPMASHRNTHAICALESSSWFDGTSFWSLQPIVVGGRGRYQPPTPEGFWTCYRAVSVSHNTPVRLIIPREMHNAAEKSAV